jgi:anti-sigma regulatory factor (Ser/Thr protein kinase)
MTTTTFPPPPTATGGFVHEALFYAGPDGLLAAVTAFLRDAVDLGEPALVILDTARIDTLRHALGVHEGAVRFADMSTVGTNPARFIPAWQDFVADHVGSRRWVRGVGEPVRAGCSADELDECRRHEALLNVAFNGEVDGETEGTVDWWLVCPYDTKALDRSVLDEAEANHPWILEVRGDRLRHRRSPTFRATPVAAAFDGHLPDPIRAPDEITFDVSSLAAVRTAVGARAAALGFDPATIAHLVLAVHEVAANSLRHGSHRGLLRTWPDGETLVCEVRGGGQVTDPLAGRRRPSAGELGGRGLWLVNQVCDLVQIRSGPDETVVRLRMSPR